MIISELNRQAMLPWQHEHGWRPYKRKHIEPGLPCIKIMVSDAHDYLQQHYSSLAESFFKQS